MLNPNREDKDIQEGRTAMKRADVKKFAVSHRKALLLGIAILSAGILLCAILLVKDFWVRQKAENELDRLRDTYVSDSLPQETDGAVLIDSSGGSTEIGREEFLNTYSIPEKTVNLEAIQEKENNDIYAWITIPDTPIDYPVVQHPEEADYYLKHNLDGSQGYPGCIYTELYNSKSWDDPDTVLYGHNLKNGEMFASLHKYSDPEFFAEHQYVYIYTPDKVRVYRIFAAYEFSDVHLVKGIDLSTSEAFTEYLDEIYRCDGPKDYFDKEVSVTAQDKLITLSTCIKNKPDARYLVQAKLVAEG